MNKSTKILIAAGLILGISGSVFAFGKHGHWGMSPEDKAEFVTERVTKKLDLNETQRQNLQTLVGDVMVFIQEMRSERETHKIQIQEMIIEPVLDQGRALQMIETKTQQVSEKVPVMIASLASFLDSLDGEQKAQLKDFVAKGMHQGRGHKEHSHE